MSKPKRYVKDYELDAWRPLDAAPTPGFVATAVLAAMAFALVVLLGQVYFASQQFSQTSFPCQEDEVLTYAPQFGPNRVGCINFEEVR